MNSKPSFKTTLRERKFLGVQFVSCACYGRLYMNDEGTAYVGRCPRCNTAYQVRIGATGTSQRMFQARCR